MLKFNLMSEKKSKKISIRSLKNPSVLAGIAAFLFIVVSLSASFLVKINPNEYGIKQINIGINPGIQDDIYTAGLHFIMPFGFEKMHIFPRDIQVLDLNSESRVIGEKKNQSRSVYTTGKPAHIQTSDGFFVDVDVSILYKIQNPLLVLKTIGPGNLFIYDGIEPKSEPVLKDTLGTLTTEEFYNPHLRVEKMLLAKEKLNEELTSKGLIVDQVLVRYFRYSDEIQRNIEEKKLKDQLVFKNIAESKAATEEALLNKTIEEGEAQVKIELEKGLSYVTIKNADKDLYVRKKKAAANLLVKNAEAKQAKLKNQALIGKGASNMVGLKMAEVLDGLEVIFISTNGKDGINPLNLNQVLKVIE
jgi:regulator of protease activity HflC (stomatin/prohibitin superfamily)